MPKRRIKPDYEAAKARICGDLERFYSDTPTSEVVAAVDLIEDSLQRSASQEVVSYVCSQEPGLEQSPDATTLTSKDAFFEVSMGLVMPCPRAPWL